MFFPELRLLRIEYLYTVVVTPEDRVTGVPADPDSTTIKILYLQGF